MPIPTERILMLGLHPSALDYSNLPDVDEPTLTARIEAGNAALRAAGFDAVGFQIPADPARAESEIREHLSDGPFGLVMIGAGIPYTLLFERIINVVTEAAPGVRFNTSPENTVDTPRRWIQP
ncbi:hypothetical protein [Nocardia miyunensis]|uniref:hypothetical protein n=1 Tax=Nocardia miyunensis TaxID=282684 RepID=UPI001C3FB419|nr:hypothetical protein [Nocardia miyunensis]